MLVESHIYIVLSALTRFREVGSEGTGSSSVCCQTRPSGESAVTSGLHMLAQRKKNAVRRICGSLTARERSTT